MRKSLIAAVFSAMLAVGYLTVSTPVANLPVAHAEPMCPKKPTPGDEDPERWIWVPCSQLTGAQPPPMQNPLDPAAPHNGCFVAGTTTTSNLLKECPNTYTCASILDDEMREECNSSSLAGQTELLNMVGQDNPTGLYPTPLTAAGVPPAPPDTGPCAGSSMPTLCSALLGMAVWTSDQIAKHPAPACGGANGLCPEIGTRG